MTCLDVHFVTTAKGPTLSVLLPITKRSAIASWTAVEAQRAAHMVEQGHTVVGGRRSNNEAEYDTDRSAPRKENTMPPAL